LTSPAETIAIPLTTPSVSPPPAKPSTSKPAKVTTRHPRQIFRRRDLPHPLKSAPLPGKTRRRSKFPRDGNATLLSGRIPGHDAPSCLGRGLVACQMTFIMFLMLDYLFNIVVSSVCNISTSHGV